MPLHVIDNPDRSRFELVEDGQVIGYADYARAGRTLVLPHTVITPERRGRGLGEVLVRGALDAARREGWRVEPRCWYVAEFLETHPEYADLAA